MCSLPNNTSDISVVIATHNRASLVYRKVNALLHNSYCAIIVVADSCTDSTVHVLQEISDQRLKVIKGSRLGAPRARNLGLAHSRSPYTLMLDDDDEHSPGYAQHLLASMTRTNSDIVGAPWFMCPPGAEPAAHAASLPRVRCGPSKESPAIFPTEEDNHNVWIPGNALFRTSVLKSLRYDEGYRVNFWRDETDLYVRAEKAGYKVSASPHAYSYLKQRLGGGIQKSNRLKYEAWVLLNNSRFTMKHWSFLRDSGFDERPFRSATQLYMSRAQSHLKSAMRKRGM